METEENQPVFPVDQGLAVAFLLLGRALHQALRLVVSNVRVVQRLGGKRVGSCYSVTDSDCPTVNVSIQVLRDDDVTYGLRVAAVSPHYGPNVEPGLEMSFPSVPRPDVNDLPLKVTSRI